MLWRFGLTIFGVRAVLGVRAVRGVGYGMTDRYGSAHSVLTRTVELFRTPKIVTARPMAHDKSRQTASGVKIGMAIK